MTVFLEEMDGHFGFLPPSSAKTKGLELTAEYISNEPFPHIVIDDFMPPSLLDLCLEHFPKSKGEQGLYYSRDQERLKTQYHPDELPPWPRTLFYAFNSRPFIRVLENITGIKGLAPDPYFLGGGFHEIATGGHLSIHADFNHHEPLNMERRINVLIYLNKDWKDEYGGQLELWDPAMTRKVRSIVPAFNRCVIFNTDSTSYHGNPQVVRHPEGVSRKSIALFYYTSTWTGLKRERTTQFRVRTGTADKVDWQVRIRELIEDITPPVMARAVRKLRHGPRASAEAGRLRASLPSKPTLLRTPGNTDWRSDQRRS